jgi:hypothetical protein
VGALLVEMNDEMIAADRRYIAAGSVAALSTTPTVYRPCQQHPAPDNRSTVLHHAVELHRSRSDDAHIPRGRHDSSPHRSLSGGLQQVLCISPWRESTTGIREHRVASAVP